MFAKLAILFVAVAAASAGYLQSALPAVAAVPSIRTYVQHTPVAIPQPPITYSVPPTARADHLAPVVSSSYGFSTSHIPGPAPIIRAHPVQAPLFGHDLGLARGYATGFGFGSHYAPALGLGRNFNHGLVGPAFGYAGGYAAAPFAFGRTYGAGFAAPTIGYAGAYGASPLYLGRGYEW
ncbi:hypothetical protein RI129_010950 [Pyrocoelia pectoralis]|uniref:Uncharacterized protein n=1 Tax=Pyrocoelia pectoralis TaxID=417401 RepID=A0AAN7VA89_9COLE